MLCVVIFVATRNIFTAFWLSLGLILTIGYLFNEHSSLYLFGEPIPLPTLLIPSTVGLTPEEQEIYKRLHDKVGRVQSSEELQRKGVTESLDTKLIRWYRENMGAIQKVIN